MVGRFLPIWSSCASQLLAQEPEIEDQFHLKLIPPSVVPYHISLFWCIDITRKLFLLCGEEESINRSPLIEKNPSPVNGANL